MAFAFKNFDYQYKHNDGSLTHANGLNIFAGIVDNTDGELLGLRSNKIHSETNPMLHAEQLTLATAIKRVTQKRPRIHSLTSVENYYRNFLFNDPASTDPLQTGSTIYTTLEPCPFCTAALLVNRMKRIVFIIPDKKFGSAYTKLKTDYYPSYNMTYEPLSIKPYPESALTQFASERHQTLLTEIEKLKQSDPNMIDTLLLDYLNPFLKNCHDYFQTIKPGDLQTTSSDLQKNVLMLELFQKQ